MFLNCVAHKKYNSLQHGEVSCCFQKLRVLIKDMQMSSETGIQDVCASIKKVQMSSETGIQDVRVLIVRIAKINSFGAKKKQRNDIRITRILEIYFFSQKIETYFSEKIIAKLQRFRTKKYM